MRDDDNDERSDDEDYDTPKWKLVEHAVDKNDGKPKFKSIVGSRKGGNQMWIFRRRAL